MEDVINKPSHYTQGSIEPIDFITANGMSFLAGNVVKYVTRYRFILTASSKRRRCGSSKKTWSVGDE
jgi:hypothetical protein